MYSCWGLQNQETKLQHRPTIGLPHDQDVKNTSLLNQLTVLHPCDSRLYGHHSLAGLCYKQSEYHWVQKKFFKHTEAWYSKIMIHNWHKARGNLTLKEEG